MMIDFNCYMKINLKGGGAEPWGSVHESLAIHISRASIIFQKLLTYFDAR